jgi:hypothetical protein
MREEWRFLSTWSIWGFAMTQLKGYLITICSVSQNPTGKRGVDLKTPHKHLKTPRSDLGLGITMLPAWAFHNLSALPLCGTLST